jgi:hypothetical protein
MFKEFLNQIPFESNFQYSATQKSYSILFPFLFWPTSIPSPTFVTQLILSTIFFSLAQLAVRPNRTFNHISFGHLRPLDASHCLWPPQPAHCSSLCHLTPAPWSRLASSLYSPPKTATPHRLPFLVSISCNRCLLNSITAASLPVFSTLANNRVHKIARFQIRCGLTNNEHKSVS